MAKGWYVVHTYSGYEKKIQRTIMKLREMDADFATVVTDVKVPEETVKEQREDGKEREVKRKLLSGYILVEIDFPEMTWKNTYSKIKRIQGVTGFVSAMEGRKPQPLTPSEVKEILMRTGEVPMEKPLSLNRILPLVKKSKLLTVPSSPFLVRLKKSMLQKVRLEFLFRYLVVQLQLKLSTTKLKK